MLPYDVTRHIYSFGYPEHRQYMKQLCEKIERGKVLDYNINIITNQHRYGRISFEELLKEVDPDILEKLFNQCVRCNCCTKHCNKRPKYLFGEELNRAENYDVNCPCKCRQFSRSIKKCYEYADNGYATLNYLFKDQFI